MTKARPPLARRPALRTLGASIGLFALLAALVQAGWLTALDDAGVLAFRGADPGEAAGPPWLALAFRDWTALGGRSAQALIFGLATGWLALAGRRREAAFLALAVVGGWLLGPLLKSVFDRPRPEVAAHLVDVWSPSFPSSHATQAAAAWGAAALLLAERARGRAASFAGLVCGLIVLLAGVSRAQLGVHYPSDILAGWCAGLAWVSALRLVWPPRRPA